MERSTFDSQKTDTPLANGADDLYEPLAHDGGERGGFDGHVRERSAYTATTMHPTRVAVLGVAAVAAVILASHMVRRDDR